MLSATTIALPKHAASLTAREDPRSHRQLWAVFLCGMFAFLDLYCMQPLLPLLARVFHASEIHASLTISASTVGVAISAVLLALFGESFDRKRMIVLAMSLLGVCTLLTATASDLSTLVLWRFLQGLLTPGIFILAIAYVTEEWPAPLVPRAMSAYIAGTISGGFLGRLLGGLMADDSGWRSVFLALGAAVLLGAVVMHRLLPPARSRRAPVVQHVSRFAPLLANLRESRLLATFGLGFV